MIKSLKFKGKVALWLGSTGLIIAVGIYFFPKEYGEKILLGNTVYHFKTFCLRT